MAWINQSPHGPVNNDDGTYDGEQLADARLGIGDFVVVGGNHRDNMPAESKENKEKK